MNKSGPLYYIYSYSRRRHVYLYKLGNIYRSHLKSYVRLIIGASPSPVSDDEKAYSTIWFSWLQ